MAQYAAFLRGVNLGPHRRVSGAELRKAFEEMGFEDVATFRASGNVVFGGASGSEAKLKTRVEEGLLAATGMEIVVFLRSAAEMREIAGLEPFKPAVVAKSKGKLQVSILPKKASAAAQKKVLALATDEDPLAFGKRELYWLPSGGQMESDLDLQAIEKLIGPTTRRTMGTMEQLTAKFFSD
jgi:uncharacterized protein (DUF1697 family)